MSSALEKFRELRERHERAAAAAAAAKAAENAGRTAPVEDPNASVGGAEAALPRVSPPPAPPPSLPEQPSVVLPASAPPSFLSPASAILRYRDPVTDGLASVTTADMVAAAAASVLRLQTDEREASPATADEESAGSTGRKRPRDENGTGQSALSHLADSIQQGWSVLLEAADTRHDMAALSSQEGYERACRCAKLDVSGAPLPRCRDVNRYRRQDCIAQGVYGVVFSAVEAATGKMFALKHIKKQWLEESQIGFPPYLLREFDLLLRLRHPNVVRALELVVLDPDRLPGEEREREREKGRDGDEVDDTHATTATNDEPQSKLSHPSPPAPAISLPRSGAKDVFLVMEYCPFDLKHYMLRYSSAAPHQPYLHVTSRSRGVAAVEENFLSRVKCIAMQLFRGLAFLHAHRIMHRDIKTSNVLLSEGGLVKICDFGLGRHYREGQQLTPTVVTLMYRAPELHFGVADYSHKMDVWSMGCVVAELFLKAPLFRAAEEVQHLLAVCDVLGIPTEESFPGVYKLPRAKEAMRVIGKWNRTNKLAEVFYGASDRDDRNKSNGVVDSSVRKPTCYDAHLLPRSGLDLLQRIFCWNPADRPSAAEVLAHPFFSEAPLPCEPAELTRPMPSGVDGDGTAQLAPSFLPAAATGAASSARSRRSGGSAPPPLVHVKDTVARSERPPSQEEEGGQKEEEEEEMRGDRTCSLASDSNMMDGGSLTYSNAMSPAGVAEGQEGRAAAPGAPAGAPVDARDLPAQGEAEVEWQAMQRAQLLANRDVEDG